MTSRSEPDQKLSRGLSVRNTIALSISDITPMASLLVIAPVVLATAGTGALWAYVIGCFIAINVALCMGELGSMFPVAGGLYSIVTRVLGKPVGFLALLDYIAQGVFIPASIALGIGTYIHKLIPAAPINITSAAAMALVTVITMLKINLNAVLVGVFLAIEVAVIALLSIAGLANLHQPLSILTNPMAVHTGSTLATIGGGAVVGALATAMFSVNGYDSAINFSEETVGSAANVGKAVFIACLSAIFLELVPFIASVFAAPDLKVFLASSTPLTDLVSHYWGSTLADIMIAGAVVAIFNAVIAITLQFARILWASARDQAWPLPISQALFKVSPRFKSPWFSTLIVGACATALAYNSSLVSAVTFTGVLLIVLYGLIAVAALVSRVTQKERSRPSKMPLWPLPPLIALAGVLIALSQQTFSDLATVGGIFLAGLVYYYFYLYPRRHTHWVSESAGPEINPQV